MFSGSFWKSAVSCPSTLTCGSPHTSVDWPVWFLVIVSEPSSLVLPVIVYSPVSTEFPLTDNPDAELSTPLPAGIDETGVATGAEMGDDTGELAGDGEGIRPDGEAPPGVRTSMASCRSCDFRFGSVAFIAACTN